MAERSPSQERAIIVIANVVIFGSLALLAFGSRHWILAVIILLFLPLSISQSFIQAARRRQRKLGNAPAVSEQMRVAEALDGRIKLFILRLGGTLLRSVLVFAAFFIATYLIGNFGPPGIRLLAVALLLIVSFTCLVIYPIVRMVRLYSTSNDADA